MKKNIDTIGNIYYQDNRGFCFDENGKYYNPICRIEDYVNIGFNWMEAYALRYADFLYNAEMFDEYYFELINKLGC